MSHHEWKQQQQQQPHPVSNGDYPSASLATSEVTYEEILKWTAAEWRIIDVLRHDGLIDRFTIVDTADSIFPIINQDAANLPPGVRQPSLATVPLGLRYEGTVDPAGRPLRTASSGHYTPISVFSRLYQTPDGLLGQVTSDGFFAFELRLPNGHHVDLKGSKLFMSFKNHTEINRRTSFNVNNGLLAICNLRNVRIYDLYQASSSLVTKINNGLPRVVLEGVTWISECEVVLLSGDGLIIVNINDGSQVPISLPRDGTEREAAPILYAAMIMCPQQTCLLLLDQHGRRMVRLALARPLSTCGRISRPMAYIKEGRQLHLLAMPPSLFSTNEGQSSVASLRDSSVVWKSLDIPFQAYLQGSLNGPIRVACQDDHTKWMLLAGRTGFCIFNHFGSGSGNWMLFSDPQECKTLTVKLATWIQVGDPESMAPSPSPVLSLYMWDEERGQHEFLLFVISEGRRFLSLHGAAHRQIVEGRIVALQDCGQGVLAILLDDAVLQLVQISMRKPSTSPTLRMSLILRASLDGVLTMGALKKTIQLTYVQDQTLLLVRSEDGLLGVTIPLVLPTDESLDHQRDISAKILTKGRISDFLVWPTGGGQHWIMAQVGQRLHCREVPLTTGRSFEFEGSLHSFYPSQAYGLGLKVELAGNGSIEHPHRLMVTGTEAFIVHLLHYLISLEGDDEGEHFYQLARSLDRRKISVFLLILEMLLERVLSSAPPAQQARIYRRLKYRLQDLVTGSEYRQVLFRFLRRIEAEDARRVMSLLGPFGELFERALRGRELLAAWSFYRIASTGTVSEREGYQLSARGQDLLERALEERQLAILRGMLRLMGELQVRDFQPSLERLIMLSNKKRDWPTLEILYEEGLLPLHQIKVNPDVSVDQILANCMLHSSIGKEGLCCRPKFINFHLAGRNDLLRSLIPMTLGGLDDVQSPITGLLQKISLPIESALWACIVEGRGYNEPVLASVIRLKDLVSIICNTYDIL